VVDARLAATRIKVLRLAATSGRFPATDAGAHLEVGVVLRDRLKDWREYTIVAHDPKGRWLEIAVLRDDKGRGGSLFMHDEVHPGSEVRVRIPENDFRLDRSAVHSILIAGGIGITPILAMARELDRTNSSAEAHYSARGRDAAAFLHELEELPLVNCKFYDTSAGALARMDLTKVIGDYRVGTHVYVCGPQQLIDQTYRIAEELGYPAEALHSEAFAAPSAKLSDATIEVKFARSGKTTNVQPGQTLLDAALAEGISVSYSCKRGECGLCVTEVLEGQPDHRDRFLKPNEKPGKICLCVSWVSSPTIVLDA
jgi:vanillate O-demethylase ferredoxin subunit